MSASGRALRVVRVASDIELHVTMHNDRDGRLRPLYLHITYSDVRRGKTLPVICVIFFSSVSVS